MANGSLSALGVGGALDLRDEGHTQARALGRRRARERGDRCRRSARAGHVVWTRHGVACPAEDTKIVSLAPGQKLGVRGVVAGAAASTR